jgi:N-dimethylarginine dimethylaminohydrolase
MLRSRALSRQSEVAPLQRVLLKHPTDAFLSPSRISEQWRSLGYSGAPDYDRACQECDDFGTLLETLGVAVEWMPSEDLGLDSLYVRDASVITDSGAILCGMGKGARVQEPPAQGKVLEALGIPIKGSINPPATVEGGDVAWLAHDLLAVGRSYRTNARGVELLAQMLPEVEVMPAELPHWRGPAHVLHLMSLVSPLAEDLLLVYSPLLPHSFRDDLLHRGFGLVEVPEEEFESQGCNVLAVAPSVAVALEGNPETRRRMEAAGVEVHTYVGYEISVKGSGGPTCLTRPLERGA